MAWQQYLYMCSQIITSADTYLIKACNRQYREWVIYLRLRSTACREAVGIVNLML